MMGISSAFLGDADGPGPRTTPGGPRPPEGYVFTEDICFPEACVTNKSPRSLAHRDHGAKGRW